MNGTRFKTYVADLYKDRFPYLSISEASDTLIR